MMQQFFILTYYFCALNFSVCSFQFNVGVVHNVQSMIWQNVRHTIDEWNNANAAFGFSLNLIAPTDPFAGPDARFCDIAQRRLIALIIPFSGATSTSPSLSTTNNYSEIGKLSRNDILLILSMCNRFKLPCIVDKHINSFSGTNFILNIGFNENIIGNALSQLISKLMWNSFLIIYQKPEDIIDVADLLSVWHTYNGARTAIKLLQLPQNTQHYDLFLKHIRERLRITNIVIHTDELSIIHTLLVRANRLNMTEGRYSYLFTNTDLRLLEDFFAGLDNAYHCNISGIQLIRHKALLLKTDLMLTFDAISLIGETLKTLNEKHLMLEPQALLCDAGDTWNDGNFFVNSLKELNKPVLNENENYINTETDLSYNVYNENIEDGLFEENDLTTKINHKPIENVPSIATITRSTNNRFIEIGVWNNTDLTWEFDKKYDQSWRFRTKFHFKQNNSDYPDLSGEKLRVVVYLEEPFVMKKFNNDDELNKEMDGNNKFVNYGNGKNSYNLLYEGFCIDLLCEMATILNFTFEIVEVEDGTYGVEDENGIWNGIIGVLQRNEADLSISAVTITYSRVSVIDFTLPFMHLGIAILVAKNNEENGQRPTTLFTFLEPLSFSVWIALGIAYLSVGCALCFLAKVSPYEWFNDAQRPDPRKNDKEIIRKAYKHKNQFDLLNSLWFAVGSLMHQGSDVIPRAAATRTLALVWWMFTLILISTYTAQLAAFLTAERMSTSIESAADLAAQQRIKFGLLRNGSTMDFFRESKIPIYEQMWSIMQSTSPTVFVNSSREGITRVKAGNYAYLMESSMLEFHMGSDCGLTTVGGLLDSKGYGIALPKGSPLRNLFSQAILKLQESTILEALKNKWWKLYAKRQTIFTQKSSKIDFSTNNNNDQVKMKLDCASFLAAQSSKSSHSSFQRIFGIFYVLYAGILVSVLAAIGEYCIESKNQSLRMGITIIGQFFNWINSMRNIDESIGFGHYRRTRLEIAETQQLYGSTSLERDQNRQICSGYNLKTEQTLRSLNDCAISEYSNHSTTDTGSVYIKTFNNINSNKALHLQNHNLKTPYSQIFQSNKINLKFPHRNSYANHRKTSKTVDKYKEKKRKASEPTSSSLHRRASNLIPPIFSKFSTPAISFSVDSTELYNNCSDSVDSESDTIHNPLSRQNLNRLIPQTDGLLLTRRISSIVPKHEKYELNEIKKI